MLTQVAHDNAHCAHDVTFRASAVQCTWVICCLASDKLKIG